MLPVPSHLSHRREGLATLVSAHAGDGDACTTACRPNHSAPTTTCHETKSQGKALATLVSAHARDGDACTTACRLTYALPIMSLPVSTPLTNDTSRVNYKRHQPNQRASAEAGLNALDLLHLRQGHMSERDIRIAVRDNLFEGCPYTWEQINMWISL